MTGTILQIDASGTLTGSVSRAATTKLVADLNPTQVIRRDLAKDPLPQVNETWITTRLIPFEALTPADQAVLALSDVLIAELQAADTIVIGMPMYNFGMPAALKAWIDLIARPKVTFSYTEQGSVGLLEGKRAIVSVASGGVPVDSPANFATPHMRRVLRFLGINDVTVISAKELAPSMTE